MQQGQQVDLARFPRVSLCHRPTPIESMPRLGEHLGGPNLFVKRDDCTGLATGGNKTRKLEFLVGEALQQNADVLVTQGAVQSNHVRQTAAAACRFGLGCHALLERRVEDAAPEYEHTGNVLFDRLFGTTLEFRPGGLDMNAEASAAADRLRAEGRRPYFIPGGGSNEVGALGYVACAHEIVEQAAAMAVDFDWIVMATGSTGTQAGLVAGLHALGVSLPVMGVSVRQPRERQIRAVHDLAARTLDRMGCETLPLSAVIVDDGYVGEGYGLPAESTLEAIHLAARFEGLLLDPVYSGKGFAGMVGLARANFFKPTDNVLFLHTGGSAALFAYEGTIFPRDAEAARAKS
jgi:L-cysteate sulfo-lyase